MKKQYFFIACIVCVVAGFYFGSIQNKSASNDEPKESKEIVATTYSCDNGKTIQALFFDGKVELNLSDKRSMLLLQAISGSGVRYTNNDESFVFWGKGDTAFVMEKNKKTFENCVEVKDTKNM